MDENTKSEVKPGTSAKYLQFILDGACNNMGTLDGPNKNRKRTLDTDVAVPKKRTKVQETKRFTDVPPPSAISSMYRDPLDPNFTDTRCILESGESQLSNFLRMSANTLSPTLQPLTTSNRPNSIQLNGLSVNNFSNHLSPSDMNSFPHPSSPRNIVNNYHQPLSPTHPLSPYNDYNVMSPNSNYSTLSPTHMIVNNFNNTLSPKQNYGNPITLHNSLANDISNSVQNSTGNTLSPPNAFLSAATLSPGHFSNQGNNPLSPGQNIVSPATTYILSPVMSNEGPVMVLSPVTNPLSPNMEQQYATPKGLFPAMVTNDPSSKQQNSYPTFFFSDPRNRPIHYDPLLDPVIQRKIAKGKVVTSPKPKPETTGFQELIDAFESPLEDADSQQELENLLKSLQDNN
ncbi:hypothetical protein HDV04_001109 [Boothiomyces sp. JEL0838]|nr:hypothetical protein HDV04_001109 [Boothiomyces sp. JEL0838]